MLRKLALITFFTFSSFFVQAEEFVAPTSLAPLVKKLLPTVVNVSTTQTITQKGNSLNELFQGQGSPFKGSPFEFFFKDFLDQAPGEGKGNKKTVSSLGSGFLISADGYIITNAHVVEKADKIDVKLQNGKSYRAKIIGSDKKSDIAILKIKSEKEYPFVKFGNSDNAEVGDWIVAIGNPFGLGGTVTAGIISARGRNISDGSNTDFIQTDAAINKGNSGGPMFNVKGELIGINTAIFSNSGGSIGIGFAIPSKTAGPIIKQLKDTGQVTRGWLGVNINLVTSEMADAIGLGKARGAYVSALVKKGPAARAGIKVDDIIVQFDGKKIEKMYALPRVVSSTAVGKRVKVVVLRKTKLGFKRKTLSVVVGKLASPSKKKKVSKNNAQLQFKKLAGLKLIELTKTLKAKYKLPSNIKGILITGFDGDSQKTSGLKKGDVISKVNQVRISTIAELEEIIKYNKSHKKSHLLLSVKRGKNTTLIVTISLD
jgi:serine protease Do